MKQGGRVGEVSTWSRERVSQLRKLRAEGFPLYEIAREFNLSESAVRRQILRLKLPRGKPRPPQKREPRALSSPEPWRGAGPNDERYWRLCLSRGGFPAANAARGRAFLAGDIRLPAPVPQTPVAPALLPPVKVLSLWKGVIDPPPMPPRSMQELMEDVAVDWRISTDDLLGRDLHRRFTWARQDFMWRCRQERNENGGHAHSVLKIAARLGKDHTTIVHGVSAHAARLADGRMIQPPNRRAA